MKESESLLDVFRRRFLLEIVVFTSGALVMIYEIAGSRILAPYIGTSTYVWTSLIGVILASLSVGYWIGGKIADQQPELKYLSGVMFLAAAMLSATILLHEFILTMLAVSSLGLEIKSVIAALILFAPASVLFGFVTPYAIKLKMLSIENAGQTVGRLSALSTVGSILGTFTAGFFLLPFVGSLRTLYLIAGLLLLLSILLAPFKLTITNLFVILLFLSAIGANEFYRFALFQTIGLRDFDTQYSRIRVFRSTDKKTNKPITALTIDPLSTQSAIFADSDDLVFDYTKYYHLLRHFKPKFQQTLMIGGAGYSFPKDYLQKYQNAALDVVEIDPQMTEIARHYFRLQDNPRLKIIHQDGRVFLNQSPDEKYDAVLLDAYNSLYSIPFQLTTIEAVRRLDKILKPDGIVILNTISALKGSGSLFLQAEYKTFAHVFPTIYLFKVKLEQPADVPQNVIIVACKSNCPAPTNGADEETVNLLENYYDEPLDLTMPALTDDLAPVEYYNSLAQSASRR
ncbi:MAG: fused MFS/spermidine synthase [Pyrinomonadaceae bacterium]